MDAYTHYPYINYFKHLTHTVVLFEMDAHTNYPYINHFTHIFSYIFILLCLYLKRWLEAEQSGMAVIEVKLVSGFRTDEESLEKVVAYCIDVLSLTYCNSMIKDLPFVWTHIYLN